VGAEVGQVRRVPGDGVRVPVADGALALAVRHWVGPEGAVPFLLVHGLASNARLWDGVATDLAGRGHGVAAVDQRGHGQSDKPDDGYDFASVAGDLVDLIGALGLDRPVAVGQSWGGNVVMELAARHPELVRGVVGVDGGWIDLRRFPTFEACAAAMSPPDTVGMPAADIEAAMRRRHRDWPETGIQGALACFEMRADGTVAPWLTRSRHLAILRAMWEQRIDEVHRRVAVPVLLVPCDDGSGSERMERKRREVAKATARLAVARTAWFTAHHDVHAQRPTEVASLLSSCVEDGFFS
jgi:pimeloyl-ACP methyl ester carboxylesterase